MHGSSQMDCIRGLESGGGPQFSRPLHHLGLQGHHSAVGEEAAECEQPDLIGFAQWAHQAFHAHQITDYPSRKDQAGRRKPLGLIRAAVAARTTTILNSGPTAPLVMAFSSAVPAAERLPVTVLTGYLGAGKTTLLNRILTHEHGLKVAVIVNEFGEVGIDNQLVVDADEEIFEMNNGCICCTVRGDLIRIIGNLMKRRDRFDHLVIETTGLADPAPVIQTFFVDEDLRDELRLDAVVTLVDLKHVGQHWEAEEVQEQLAFADVLVLNKADLVSDAERATIERRVRAINPVARLLTSHKADVPIQELLGVEAFELERALSLDPGFLAEEHAHEHDDAVGSVALVEDRPMDLEKLGRWLSDLVAERGPDLFRMKGIIQLQGEARRYVFQSVHMLLDGDFDRPWKAAEPRRTELVIIGRNLDAEALRASFLACVA
jgi:G3E family GTPase